MVSSSAPPLVLVAEDDDDMRGLVARHLQQIVHPKLDIIQAEDGDVAWRLAQEHLPDLVVLDVMMPGMSGWEVCRKLRENAALAHTGVVMLTGIGENLNQMTSPLYGADAYLDKPFEFEDLAEKVKEVLDARASQREAVPRPVKNGVAAAAKPAASAKGKGGKRKVAAAKKTIAKKKSTKSGAQARKGAAAASRKGKANTMAAKKAAKKGAAKKTAKKGAAKKSAKKAAKKK